jgi:hypothetical protein
MEVYARLYGLQSVNFVHSNYVRLVHLCHLQRVIQSNKITVTFINTHMQD